MASNLGSLAVYLTANTSQFESALTSAQRTLSGFGKSILAIAGVTGIGAFAKQSMDVYKAQLQEENRLGAVLAATGNAAGLTKIQMVEYSKELQKLTGLDDENIIHTEAMLSTFKNIRGDTFKRVTAAAYDMAAVLGTDASGAAMKLGRMLNNPAEGLTALSRVGITFNDQQKKQIELMQQSGDLAGAQSFILKELEGRFGGTAAAMNTGGKQMKRAFEDLEKSIGHVLVEIMGVTTDAKGGLTHWLQETSEKIDKTAFEFGFAFQSMAIDAKAGFSTIIALTRPVWENIWEVLQAARTNLGNLFSWIGENWQALWDNAYNISLAFVKDLGQLFHGLGQQIWREITLQETDWTGYFANMGKNMEKAMKDAKITELKIVDPKYVGFGGMDKELSDIERKAKAEQKALIDTATKRKMLEAEKNNKEQNQARKAQNSPYDLGLEAQKGVEQKVSMALVRGTMEAYKAEAQSKHDATMVTLTQQIAKNTQKMADSKNTTINVNLQTVDAFGGQ